MERIRWRSAFVEGFAVLVGILLAFGVDAAWDVRRQRQETRDYLRAVRAELEANLERIPSDVEFIESVMEETSGFIETVSGMGTSPTYEQVVDMVRGMSPRRPGRLAQSAMNDLVSSGGFSRIESRTLRSALAEYQRLLAQDEAESNDISDYWAEEIQPYHIRHGTFPFRDVSESRTEFPLPVEHFAANRVYSNILAVRRLAYGDVRRSRREVADHLVELLDLMDGAF